jgi:hypothetical protein
VQESDRKREDDWFRKNEKQLLEAARVAREKREKERAAQESEAERKRVRELHFMKCPKCGHDLKEELLDEVTIDRCSFCEGIYLDAGELDTLFLKKEKDQKGFFGRLLKL